MTLLPCPFCGEENIVTVFVRDGRRAVCGCGASVVRFHGKVDAETTVREAWNRRTLPASPPVSVAAAERSGEACAGKEALDKPKQSPPDTEELTQPTNPHDWMFDGRIMFCRRCFKRTAAPGRDGSDMDGECKGFGEISIIPVDPALLTKGTTHE